MSNKTQHISSILLLVKDYDEAIAFYTNRLGFTLIEDTDIGNGKRWVQVAPAGSSGTRLVFKLATNEQHLSAVGNQAGGGVLMIIQTDDFWRDYQAMKEQGVTFLEQPRKEGHGTVVIFEDLHGNQFDLLEPKS